MKNNPICSLRSFLAQLVPTPSRARLTQIDLSDPGKARVAARRDRAYSHASALPPQLRPTVAARVQPASTSRQKKCMLCTPWASEDTFEELTLGFECSFMSVLHRQSVYVQLGRSRALKRLDVCWSSLVPRIDYGAEQLGNLVSLQEFSWRFGQFTVPDAAVVQMLVQVAPELWRIRIGWG
ncbi:hypothetical protein BG000_008945 [Podila horticola]|nr:hypothetical protein BG000_008945 [Podila horticola]